MARPLTAGGRKYGAPALTMADITPWRHELSESYGVFVRIIWSRGIRPSDWKVTGQAYKVVGNTVVVMAEYYLVWPAKGYKTVEGMMLRIVMELEKALGEPVVGASAD